VTFLFTDIEASTQLWEQHPQAIQAALTRHDAILADTITAHGGVVVKSTGDGMLAAFMQAPHALAAALEVQRALQAEEWGAGGPLRVRMALHTGVAQLRNGDYFGPTLNRAARLLAAGHGGQVLLSRATAELLHDHLPGDVELRDLGEHRLKDLSHPEHIFHLVAPDLPTDFPPLKTLDQRHTNLLTQPTALVGRTKEIASVCALLHRADARLVTLTGPGGTGKTRLAVHVAAELLDAFADGVWFVDLSPINDPDLVIPTIMQTIGLKEIGTQPPLEQLKAYLRDKHLLLVLDNFEQVVDAASRVAELLAAPPQLEVLITSRVVLRLRGEQEFQVPPLALPDPKQLPPLEALSQYAAVELFIQRAQDVKPDFQVTNANAPAVAEICHRLDGLPLAIELAAAWIKLFAPEVLLKRLERRLPLLTGGARDLPARQQALRNTIDWSYHLLDEAEKTLFTRVGVFVGGCTLEAAEVVCNANGDLPFDAVTGVAALADKSLLRQEEGLDGEPRFVMLETVREYALEKLSERGELADIHRQHATYYLTLAETARRDLSSSGAQLASMDRLEREHDNMLAALMWYQESADSVEESLRLGVALTLFWNLRGYFSEGQMWLTRALARPGAAEATVARAKALLSAADIAESQGHYRTARRLMEESLEISRTLGDKRHVAEALGYLGFLALVQGDYERTRSLYNECINLYQLLEDHDGIYKSLAALGQVAIYEADYDQATALIQQALARERAHGNVLGTANRLLDLGIIAYRQGDYVRAEAFNDESLNLYGQLGDRDSVALVLMNTGEVAYRQGNDAQAAANLTESLALHQQFGDQSGITGCTVGLGRVCKLTTRAESRQS